MKKFQRSRENCLSTVGRLQRAPGKRKKETNVEAKNCYDKEQTHSVVANAVEKSSQIIIAAFITVKPL